jgi:hypothetical protein
VLALPAAESVDAQETDTTSTVLACAALPKDFERLACYDRLATQLRAKAAGEPATTRPAGAGEVFGMTPAAEADKKGTGAAELKSITAHVSSWREAAAGGILLQLDNGQTWQQVDSSKLTVSAGDTVTISRAALGSFWISTPSHYGARVRRVH